MLTSENIQRFSCKDFNSAPTWRDLIEQLQLLTLEQLNNPVTVELNISIECIPAVLDLTGPEHDSLDEDIPVLRIDW